MTKITISNLSYAEKIFEFDDLMPNMKRSQYNSDGEMYLQFFVRLCNCKHFLDKFLEQIHTIIHLKRPHAR